MQHASTRKHIGLMGAGLMAAGLVLGTSVPAQAAPPDAEILDEDLYGGVRIGEGAAHFPVDLDFDIILDAEEFEIPDEVEMWAMSPEGDTLLIGEGETESTVFENLSAANPTEQEVELLEVNVPSAEVPTSEWYAFIAIDPATDELVTWTAYPVQLDGDPFDFGDPPRDIWPVPDPSENTEPSTAAPSLEELTGDTYGLVSILEDSPVIPLDREFGVQVETSVITVDLWLLPPGGEDAVFLPSFLIDNGPEVEFPQWSTEVTSDAVDYNGIYGLVAVDHSAGLIGWTPFGLSADGEPLQTSDPGVHQSDPAYSDRSIWPIPDSIPGPEEGAPEETESPEPEDEETTESPEPTAEPEPEGTDGTEPADTEATSDNGGTNWLVIGLASLGGLLIIGGIAYLVRSRNGTIEQ